MKNRLARNQTFEPKKVISKYRKYNRSMSILFTDFRKAYESAKRVKLWKKIAKFGFPRKIHLVKMAFYYSKAVLKMEGEYSWGFGIKPGVREGDGITPLLCKQEVLENVGEAD